MRGASLACLLVLGSCLLEEDGSWELQLDVVVDKNGFVVDHVELFGASKSDLQVGPGPLTPELEATRAQPPSMAALWRNHRSNGYITDSAGVVTFKFPEIGTGAISPLYVEDEMMIAIGWLGDQAALAGHVLVVAPEYGHYTKTIVLAPDDVEVWSSHACVRYTDGVEYIYLLAKAGCW